jgi:hypothetical protein
VSVSRRAFRSALRRALTAIGSLDDGVPESSLPDPRCRSNSATRSNSDLTVARNSAFSASRADSAARNRAISARTCSSGDGPDTSGTSHDHHDPRPKIKHHARVSHHQLRDPADHAHP